MTVDARLAAPAAACWASAGLLIAAPETARWWALALWLTASACGFLFAVVSLGVRASSPAPYRARTGHRLRVVLAVVAVCVASAAVAASAIAVAGPSRQPSELVSGSGTHVVDVSARVDAPPQRARSANAFASAAEHLQFRATANRVRAGSRVITGAMPILVFADAPAGGQKLEVGSRIMLHGTLRAAASEDASAFLLFGSGPPRVTESATGILGVTNALRSRFSRATSALPGDGGALLPGLSIGDVSSVGPALDSAMKLSSLSHLTAVSGANCAVVIAVMMMLGAALGFGRGIRIAAALVALCGFVVLVTPGPSVLRAAVMAAIVVFSTAAGRPGRGVPVLCCAVVALLVGDPWLSRDYGFALSVLATAGLLVLAPALTRALGRRMPHTLAAAIALPLAAQLACQPVLILLNPSIPLYAVGANLLAEPAAPIATVLGLVACLLLPLVPGLGYACAQLAWLPSAWIAGVARVCSSLPASQLPWLGGVLGLALMAVVLFAVIVALVRADGRRRRLVQVIALVSLLVFCGGYAGSFVGAGVGLRLARPANWQLAACDIGQGDAVLVRDGTAHGLVDVGPDPKPLAACLNTLEVTRIDLLVLTHYDQDHVGGIEAVIGRVGVALVGQPTDARDQGIIDRLARGGADVRVAGSGDRGTLGRLAWQVLWPTAGARSMQTGNEGSVTVSIAGGGIRSIFLGDLDEHAQDALLRSGRSRPVDVVKVAHHGSADQSERLYQALHARVALISVGAGNDYGHPTAKLLGILARTNTKAFRTDLQGMVLVAAGPSGSLRVWTQRQASPAAMRTPGERVCVGCRR
jgi:competence protein ComEC